jgi:hypothetical protein
LENKDLEELKQMVLEGFSNILRTLNEVLNRRENKKEDLIIDRLKIVRNLNVIQVQNLIGSSRPWALTLMKRIEKENLGFSFILGDKQRKIPSRLIYDPQKSNISLELKIKNLLKTGNILSFADISALLKLDILVYLNKIREICYKLEEEGKYEVFQGNKIHLIKS